MAKRITLNISLTPELDRFINARVASGRYQSASEVVREGLRLLDFPPWERITYHLLDAATPETACPIGLPSVRIRDNTMRSRS